MRRAIGPLVVGLMVSLWVGNSHALEIVEPAEGQRVEVGSTLRVVVKPQAGEKWVGVAVAFEALVYDGRIGAYVGQFPVPDLAKLGLREILVTALADTDQEVRLRRQIIVVLPPTTVLTGLRVDDDQMTLRMRTGSGRKLSVYGKFSDGIERDVSSIFGGTTYSTGNEKVARVDSSGLVTAIGQGTTKITIKNNRYELTIDAVVKPKR